MLKRTFYIGALCPFLCRENEVKDLLMGAPPLMLIFVSFSLLDLSQCRRCLPIPYINSWGETESHSISFPPKFVRLQQAFTIDLMGQRHRKQPSTQVYSTDGRPKAGYKRLTTNLRWKKRACRFYYPSGATTHYQPIYQNKGAYVFLVAGVEK